MEDENTLPHWEKDIVCGPAAHHAATHRLAQLEQDSRAYQQIRHQFRQLLRRRGRGAEIHCQRSRRQKAHPHHYGCSRLRHDAPRAPPRRTPPLLPSPQRGRRRHLCGTICRQQKRRTVARHRQGPIHESGESGAPHLQLLRRRPQNAAGTKRQHTDGRTAR